MPVEDYLGLLPSICMCRRNWADGTTAALSNKRERLAEEKTTCPNT